MSNAFAGLAFIVIFVVVALLIAAQPTCKSDEVRVRAVIGTACVSGHR